jgi:hypothetical protein
VVESDEDKCGRGRTRTDLVVQDTDEEDEVEDVPSEDAPGRGRELGCPNAEKSARSDGREENPYNNDNPRRSGRSRSRPRRFYLDTVFAVKDVKKVTKKMGGARPGAGRKRKRPVVFNSDDE